MANHKTFLKWIPCVILRGIKDPRYVKHTYVWKAANIKKLQIIFGRAVGGDDIGTAQLRNACTFSQWSLHNSDVCLVVEK